MFKRLFLFAFIFCSCCLVSPSAQAADIVALESQVKDLSRAVSDLRLIVDAQAREIASLKSAQPPQQPPAFIPQPAPSTPGVNKFLEMGAVADIAVRMDSPKTDDAGADRVNVREVELVMGANVDPYCRLDSTIAFTEESTAELEEAYLTRFELPWDITARIGRFKPRLGKAIATHRDALDTVDEPLVIQRYFGSEGMSKSGVDLKKILDLPTPFTHEVTLGVLEGGNGEGGTAFGDTRRRPTFYGHLKNYLDISDDTGLELGLSGAIGSRDADSEMEVGVLGFDGTLIHHFDANRNLKLQSEIFSINRTESQTVTLDDTTGDFFADDLDGNVWGGYALADLRLASQWATGFRFDQVELIDRPVDSPERYDRAYSVYLTFYQSEFARWRAQFTHVDPTDGNEDNQVWLQGTFAIGEHKHKLS